MEPEEKPQGELHLTKLEPADILMMWDLLFHFLRSSGLYRNPLKIVQMLLDAMIWRLEFWVIRRFDGDNIEFIGLMGTQIYKTPYTEECIFSVVHGNIREGAVVTTKEWQQVYKALIRYARGKNAAAVEIFSVNPRVQRLLSGFGFQPSAYKKEL